MTEQRVKCTSCNWGNMPHEGRDEIRKCKIDLKQSDFVGQNGSAQIIRPCPKCSKRKLVKA